MSNRECQSSQFDIGKARVIEVASVETQGVGEAVYGRQIGSDHFAIRKCRISEPACEHCHCEIAFVENTLFECRVANGSIREIARYESTIVELVGRTDFGEVCFFV